MAAPDSKIKITLVGDGAVGKTCLLIRFNNNYFRKDYVPTIFEKTESSINVKGTHYNLDLSDTAGQEEYDRLRSLDYPNTNVFLVCFSVDNPNSFESVKTKWVPEVRHHKPHTPIVLIGTKSDLTGKVKQARIIKLKKDIKAATCLTCSAKTGEGVRYVFEEAVRIAQTTKSAPRSRKCVLL